MVKESNRCWNSDVFKFRCDNGKKLQVTFAIGCGGREALELGGQHRRF
jgi:putative transposase